ncbi:MAG: hypothetical protein OXQ94_14690 [Gemmatimonadota bacterium]|nr:hypothetical protein [Gemmatimonadota bacterium]MDE2872922.1 hypothetical protein [Gemmatimonadota bacterium]
MDELRQLDGFINIHADLTDADLDILRYPGADSACDAASSLPDSSTVFKVNEVCGTSANLEDWKNTVVAHEEAHQTSLNKCISDQRTQTEITEMANLVENDEAKLQSDLTKRWNLLRKIRCRHEGQSEWRVNQRRP